jgi:hypothetical protein
MKRWTVSFRGRSSDPVGLCCSTGALQKLRARDKLHYKNEFGLDIFSLTILLVQLVMRPANAHL